MQGLPHPPRSHSAAARHSLDDLDPSAVNNWLAWLGIPEIYRDSLAAIVDISALTSRPFVEIAAMIEASHATEPALTEFARAINAAINDKRLSNEARFAIASYTAIFVFSICSWFYLMYPKIATLILDTSTIATWASIVGRSVYRQLDASSDK